MTLARRRSVALSVMLVLVLGAGVLATQVPGGVHVITPRASTCFSATSTGAGATLFNECLSKDGNIVLYESPAGRSHMTSLQEGYVLCAGGDQASYYDAGTSESGWGPATTTQPNGPNTFPLTID